MKVIKATYEIVTPMFIGGSSSSETAELRPPSIKGILRFWWRALYWLKVSSLEVTDKQKLIRLHDKEAELFGLAASDNSHTGQGNVTLKLDKNSCHLKSQSKNDDIIPNRNSGHEYLLGQGLFHFNDHYLRSCLTPNQEFSIHLLFKSRTSDADIESVEKALLIMGLLGGFGSRQRSGFGSIAIKDFQYTNVNPTMKVPRNVDDFKQIIKDIILNEKVLDIPPYTAFSNSVRIDISDTGKDALALLGEVGQNLQMYRSYGRSVGGIHKVGYNTAEQNFSADHDLIRDLFSGDNILMHPQRVVFGLPHNYFYSTGKKADINPVHLNGQIWTDKGRSRRASPLMIHIHRFPNKQYAVVQTLMPALFLPDGDKILLKQTGGGNKNKRVEVDIDWQIIKNYMERFANKKRII